jgi:hypothetical protein
MPFGAYVQANQENSPTNTNKERTIDAIYLRPHNNIQGGHELMDLNTGAVITRRKVTEIPVTTLVIKAVEEMAYAEGFKSLKFRNRHGVVFHDTDWIPGVDYEDRDGEEETIDEECHHDENVDEEPIDEADTGLVDTAGLPDNDDNINQSEIDEILLEDALPPIEGVEDEGNEDANNDDEEVAEEGNMDDDQVPENVNAGAIEVSDQSETESQISYLRRSERTRQPVDRLDPKMSGTSHHLAVRPQTKNPTQLEHCHNLMAQVHPNPSDDESYNPDKAMLIARTMCDMYDKTTRNEMCFGQMYILQKGLKEFEKRGSEATSRELEQLHQRHCFAPIAVSELTPIERRKAMESLMFLTEKRDKRVKGRMVYNGKPTREWLSREDSASPTAALESIMLTAAIDMHEKRDVMCVDIPNAFIQTHMPEIGPGDERVIMKITGVLVQMLTQLNPELYGPHVVYEKGKQVLYVQVLRAIYGMLQASLLWYNKFRKDLEGYGFKFNPYDPCVANKTVNNAQHTIRFHVDDLMSSHRDPAVNSKFEEWLQKKYGKHARVVSHRGKTHDYLGMTLHFEKERLKVDMTEYVEDMIKECSQTIKSTDKAATPATVDLFNLGLDKKLDKKRAEEFHTIVAKGLFVAKRARPDIHPTIALLCTRVRAPNESDWIKMIRLLKYLNCTKNDKLSISIDNVRIVKWYVDAAYAVHSDYKSHTGATMTFGKGAIQTISRKQKLNTRSSTEAELVAADDAAVMILWTRQFLEEQGYGVERNVLYQDNKSTILLENNGRRSSSKRTRHLNVRYFFLTDQIEKGKLLVEYCPTDKMIGDYMSKPLQGTKFQEFRNDVMGL